MNLVEQLLKADIKKADELETSVFKSHKLAKVLGVKPTEDNSEPTVDVTIREVKSRRVNDIMSYQINKKGNLDYSKTYDAKLMMCIEGVVDPDLRDKSLQEHFEVGDAKALCDKLFGFEINDLSDAISALSGIRADNDDEDEEEEIKNS